MSESTSPNSGAVAPPGEASSVALKAAQEAIAAARKAQEEPSQRSERPDGARPFEIPELGMAEGQAVPKGIDLLGDVNLQVKIELGRTRMLVEDVLKLGEGAVVELDKLAGDPVDVYVNDRHVARGEVLVLNDNFCVRINEIIEPQTGGPDGL
jgi:flagellar motor switch protein FliN/FliY